MEYYKKYMTEPISFPIAIRKSMIPMLLFTINLAFNVKIGIAFVISSIAMAKHPTKIPVDSP